MDIMVPTLGETVTEATVATWFKKQGDTVAVDEMLCELETDKVSVEVPAPAAGVMTKIIAEEGATVEAGGKLAIIASGAASAKSAPAAAPAAPTAAPEITKDGMKNAPSAEKMMAEKNLTTDQGTGKGRDGRIMKEDVMKASSAPDPAAAPAPRAAAPAAPVAAHQAEREERVKMTRLRQTIARRLKDSQNTAAMLTTFNEVDMTEVMALRTEYKDLFLKKHGVKLGFMSFFTKACIHALREVPEVNAEIDGTDIVLQKLRQHGHRGGHANGPRGSGHQRRGPDVICGHRKSDQRDGWQRPATANSHGRHAGRHVHDLQRRRLRLADVLAHPEPAAIRHPRHAQNPRPPDGDERRSRDPPDDVPRPVLRSPHRGRQRRCDVLGAG